MEPQLIESADRGPLEQPVGKPRRCGEPPPAGRAPEQVTPTSGVQVLQAHKPTTGQTIHATRIGRRPLSPQAPHPERRKHSVSTSTEEVGTRFIRTRALKMTPIKPLPLTVVQNSGSPTIGSQQPRHTAAQITQLRESHRCRDTLAP